MVRAFNRINRGFGATRILVLGVSDQYMDFEIVGLSRFRLDGFGVVREFVDGWESTARSQWLTSVAAGKVRDDSGVMREAS